MAIWTFVRAHNPSINAIERFMDFGFIQTLFNAHTLPLADMWYLGEPLNYYYFGHVMGYVILSVSNVAAEPGFFYLDCLDVWPTWHQLLSSRYRNLPSASYEYGARFPVAVEIVDRRSLLAQPVFPYRLRFL